MHKIEGEIIYVYNTQENDQEWIFFRRYDDYEIIIMVKDGCGNYTQMDLTDREKLLLSILDTRLTSKAKMYTDIINILTNKLNNQGIEK